MDRGGAFFTGQSREKRLHTRWIENARRLTHANACRRESKLHPTAVARVTLPQHVSLPLQPIDRERHRRRRHPHVAREIVERHRIGFIEMVEDARLMAAEQPLSLGIPDVAGMAGEINSRVEREDLACLDGDVVCHGRDSAAEQFDLSNKILFCKMF